MLMEDADKLDSMRKGLEAKLSDWQHDIRTLQGLITFANREKLPDRYPTICSLIARVTEAMNIEKEGQDVDIQLKASEKNAKESSLKETKEKQASARLKYEAMKKDQTARSNTIHIPNSMKIVFFASEEVDVLMEKDITEIGQLAGFGVSFAMYQWRSWRTAGEMTQYQVESVEMQKNIEQYESDIAEAQVSLHKLNSKNFQLVSRLVLGPNVQG